MKRFNYMFFDVAAAPFLLMIVGVPVLLILGVVALVIVALRLINKAKAQKQADSLWDGDAQVDDLRKDDDPLEK